jgi:hypothetical protein
MGVFNVKDTQWAGGAKGDGITDDTAAINAAIAALNATAVGGRLYFPAGTYLTNSGTFTTITVPGIVYGDGFIATHIISTSTTGTLFTLDSGSVIDMRDMFIENRAASAPTSGAGVLAPQTGPHPTNNVVMHRVQIGYFYDNVDCQAIAGVTLFDTCVFLSPVRYGVRIRNIAQPDNGGWTFINCGFYAGATPPNNGGVPRTSVSALRWESCSNGHFVDCSIVGDAGHNGNNFTTGFDASCGGASGELWIKGCSIEDPQNRCISLVGVVHNINIANCETSYNNNSFPTGGAATFIDAAQAVSITGLTGNMATGPNFTRTVDFNNTCQKVTWSGIAMVGNWSDVLCPVNYSAGAYDPQHGLSGDLISAAITCSALFNVGHIGQRLIVTDLLAAPVFNATVTSGSGTGSNKAQVWWNGTAWVIG